MLPGTASSGIRSADQLAAGRDRLLAFPHHGHDRSGSDELDERFEIRPSPVFLVMSFRQFPRHEQKLGRHQPQSLSLEAADDFPDQSSPDPVRLHHHEGAFHVLIAPFPCPLPVFPAPQAPFQ